MIEPKKRKKYVANSALFSSFFSNAERSTSQNFKIQLSAISDFEFPEGTSMEETAEILYVEERLEAGNYIR